MTSITRRHFLVSATAIGALPAAAEENCVLLAGSQVGRIRAALGRDAAYSATAAILRQNAGAALAAGPWSVTTHRPDYVKTAPNEYFSEGPYWWPDPANPTGPYVRKDGQRNPARFMGNRRDLGDMCEAVLALGMGAALLGDARCAGHARLILNTWFIEAKTRMNPNLEFGQAVRGHNTGRGTGVIDTVSMIHAVTGVRLLEAAGALDRATAEGVRRWYADYLHWMTTSEKGLAEKKSGNNHATWWTAQAAAYATLAGDTAAQSMAWDHYRNYLVPTEVRPDGSCPREEARTKSLGYSAMNLDAFAVLCRIAGTGGVGLWRYRTPKGIGVEKAFYYLLPFVLHPDTWRKQQIAEFTPDGVVFPGLAGVGLNAADLLAAYRTMPRAPSPWVQLIDLIVRTS